MGLVDAFREEVARYAERLKGLQQRHEQAQEQLSSETNQLGTLEAQADRLSALCKVSCPFPQSMPDLPSHAHPF